MAFRFWPENTNVPFMKWRAWAVPISALLVVATLVAIGFNLVTKRELGLNLGVDFRGGVLIEAETRGPANLSQIRAELSALGLGDVQVQSFGAPTLVLVRAELAGDAANASAVVAEKIKAQLEKTAPGIAFRRTDSVGGKVSAELLRNGLIALGGGLVLILLYVAFRFEWQFGVGAIVSLFHDVILTIGFFMVTQIEFNLSTVAALLTIIGYSINDTVVIFDRVREDLRKFKRMAVEDVINLSVNVTMSRTVYTNITVLLAVVAMFLWGGDVIRSFTAAMIFGAFVGTYSTVFVASPVVLMTGYRRNEGEEDILPRPA